MARSLPLSISDVLPRWTKRVQADSSGRDPLGLSRVAHLLADHLLSGIASNTDRVRYYSFYCWALWHIHEAEHPRKYSAFVGALRRRDAAIALATIAADPQASPVGVTATRLRWKQGLPRKEFDTDFRVLPSQNLGPFGQYYSGSLYDLGLTERRDDGMDRITPDHAERLAALLHTRFAKTPYIRKRLYQEATIPLGDLRRSQDTLTIDAITDDTAKAERQELISLFFALRADSTPLDERSLLRRHTLAHILHVVAEYERHGVFPPWRDVDELLVYAPYYYGALLLPRARTAGYTQPPVLARCHVLWRQFCLQQYFTRALELLLCGLLEVLAPHPAGLTLDHVVRDLVSGLSSEFRRLTGHACRKPAELFSAFGINEVPTQGTAERLKKQIPLTRPASEASISRAGTAPPSVAAARALTLLALLYGRWRNSTDDAYAHVAEHAGPELWARPVLPTLDRWLDDKTSWPAALSALVDEFILKQHDHIMFEKARLQSRWIQRTDGILLKEQDYEPAFRTSRHPSATSLLIDLGLLRADKHNAIRTTREGSRVLERILALGDPSQG